MARQPSKRKPKKSLKEAKNKAQTGEMVKEYSTMKHYDVGGNLIEYDDASSDFNRAYKLVTKKPEDDETQAVIDEFESPSTKTKGLGEIKTVHVFIDGTMHTGEVGFFNLDEVT